MGDKVAPRREFIETHSAELDLATSTSDGVRWAWVLGLARWLPWPCQRVVLI